MDAKWVPLEEHQKSIKKLEDKIIKDTLFHGEIIKELEQTKKNWEYKFNETYDWVHRLDGKIAEANKIINDALEAANKVPQPQDMKTRLTFDFESFQRLLLCLTQKNGANL